ncbi:MAG: hypothetical protein QXX77_08030 [Candidatus Methanosuratincola sp.]
MKNTYKVIFHINRGRMETKVNGRWAYPDRRWERYFPLPKSNEEWEVKIAGENPAKTVFFLLPIRFVSTYEQRCAAQLEENRRHIAEKIARLVGEDWEEVNNHLDGGKIELILNENMGTVFAKLSLDHGGFYNLEYYPREEMAKDEYIKSLQRLIDASRANALEHAREVKYWEGLISELPPAQFDNVELIADSYKVHVSTDTDWGLHEADSGYTIRVYPIVNVEAVGYNAAYNEAIKVACDELHYRLDPIAAAEDGDPKAVYVVEYASRVVMPWLFKRTVVRLSDEQVREIDLAYHDREFRDSGFETEWTMYIRRQRIAVDKMKIFRHSFFCYKCEERLEFNLNENGVYRSTCNKCGTLYAFRLCKEGDKIQLGSGHEYFYIEPRIAKQGDLEWFTEQAATPLTSHQARILTTDLDMTGKDLREILRSVGLTEEEVAAE